MVTPILEARAIEKRFGSVTALAGADFTVFPDEVVALVGDNGAGKSTLMKIVAGALTPDAGEIFFRGTRVQIETPTAARALGIETVYQDLALAGELEAAANLFLGREKLRPGILGRLGFLDNEAMRKEAAATFKKLSIPIDDVRLTVAGLSGGQRQGVAVARAVTWARKVVIMDEPTAALGVVQKENVLALIENIRRHGMAVVLISHNLPEIFAVADRIEVLRLGKRVAQFNRPEATTTQLVAAMTGALEVDG